MDINLTDVLEKSKSMSDVARAIFGKENYTNREKCKKILTENGVNWEEWLSKKNEKPKKYCLYCGKEIIGKDNRQKFCNSSCAASYNNRGISRNSKNDARFCLTCGKKIDCHHKKYCSDDCKREYEYNLYIERWKNGEENGSKGEGGVSTRIRRYLFEKYNESCQCCGWSQRNIHTNNIPLQIHHIDGDCTNNQEKNLQLLCPNCHSLTDTFGSIKNHKSKRVDRRKKYFRLDVESDLNKNIKDVSRCVICGKKLGENQTTFCSEKCSRIYHLKHINKNEILDMFKNIENATYYKVAKALNISTHCLSNKCEKFGIKSEVIKLRFNKTI